MLAGPLLGSSQLSVDNIQFQNVLGQPTQTVNVMHR